MSLHNIIAIDIMAIFLALDQRMFWPSFGIGHSGTAQRLPNFHLPNPLWMCGHIRFPPFEMSYLVLPAQRCLQLRIFVLVVVGVGRPQRLVLATERGRRALGGAARVALRSQATPLQQRGSIKRSTCRIGSPPSF